ncbi:MAG: DNA alkylation repair protein [Emergencia sp.]|nr:DNA alkylation repair protein [Emergencia sp.]
MKQIEEALFTLQDLTYRDFHSRLMPDYDKERIIGVRTPQLRKLAKTLAKDEQIREFLAELPHRYYEEDNLHSFLIPLIAADFDEALEMTETFLPYIDNWATCDGFRVKQFLTDRDRLYEKTLDWMKSDHPYTVRYGVVTQLTCFLDDGFRSEGLKAVAEIGRPEYYINMAVAWYFSFALIKQYEEAIPYFTEKRLDRWVHNKALQKAIESYRIDKETKDWFRSLKIK